MDKRNDNKMPVAPMVKSLTVGCSVQFPSDRMTVVRTTVSRISLEEHKRFTCSLNEARTTVTVTRTE